MEGLFFRPPSTLLGISSPPVTVCIDVRAHHHPVQVGAAGRSAGTTVEGAAATPPPWHSYMFPRPLRRLWPRREEGGGEEAVVDGGREAEAEAEEAEEDEVEEEEAPVERRKRGNWVMKILRIGIWADEKSSDGDGLLGKEEKGGEEEGGASVDREILDDGDRCVGCFGLEEGCDVEGEEDGEVEFDRNSFSKLLRRVSLAEARLYAQLSYLGNLAYSVAQIKTGNHLRKQGLRFVTSSLEKKSKSSSVEKEQSVVPLTMVREEVEAEDSRSQRKNGISASAAYQIAASAASYLQSQTKNFLPFRSAKAESGYDPSKEVSKEDEGDIASSEEASFVVTTNSVTAVVAAKEEVKEAVANDLNSSRSSPCEWFICDDDCSGTRYFVIQGSGSLASWQANLLFEPVQFEGLDVLVHRGIYEAAKGIYELMLPEVRAHLKAHGKSATLRFTGHSLGGSLSFLVNLMLLIRSEALASALLPVITFGAPCIMCGGNYLLQKLGLPTNHVQAITMHRDIVPRAFSCTYPNHVSEILKAVNGNFRNHPCLKHKKLLFEPMGEFLILQPDEQHSPHHHLLPHGTGLYFLGHPDSEAGRHLWSAKSVFLNSPHPLEILSDRAAYGSEGTVTRDHDMNSYLKSIRGVIRSELLRIRKAKREQHQQMRLSLVATEDSSTIVVIGQHSRTKNSAQHKINLPSVYQNGSQSMKQFGKLVATKHVQMVVVLLLPARLLLLKALAVISFN